MMATKKTFITKAKISFFLNMELRMIISGILAPAPPRRRYRKRKINRNGGTTFLNIPKHGYRKWILYSQLDTTSGYLLSTFFLMTGGINGRSR
jgi:hypothetical protein